MASRGPDIDRRHFLRAGIISAGGATAFPVIATAAGAQPGVSSPYGSLDDAGPDDNGILLPPGFSSRIVAVAGEKVGESDYEWPIFPDGAATFDDGEGGWYHTVNSEVFIPGRAGASAIHYSADGEILDAYPVLEGSFANCGGGPTPWGTFLSGEEFFSGPGKLWEIDPTGATPPVAHEAMGLFAHEAAAVDHDRRQVYLTEDEVDGRLYRYTPTSYPDLTEGLLQMAKVGDDSSVVWIDVPDPSASEELLRHQISTDDSTVFAGGEGIWYHDGWIFFSTKRDNVIHAINTADNTYERIYEADPDDVDAGTAVLSGVDNLTVDGGSGDIYVAEDGGNMEIVIITPEGGVAPFLRVVGQEGTEITGPVFNPRHDRLYFSSQRGPSPRPVSEILPGASPTGRFGGLTYEIRGPFRGQVEATPEPATTTASTTTTGTTAARTTIPDPVATISTATAPNDRDRDGGKLTAGVIGAGTAALVAAGATIVKLRNRGRRP